MKKLIGTGLAIILSLNSSGCRSYRECVRTDPINYTPMMLQPAKNKTELAKYDNKADYDAEDDKKEIYVASIKE